MGIFNYILNQRPAQERQQQMDTYTINRQNTQDAQSQDQAGISDLLNLAKNTQDPDAQNAIAEQIMSHSHFKGLLDSINQVKQQKAAQGNQMLDTAISEGAPTIEAGQMATDARKVANPNIWDFGQQGALKRAQTELALANVKAKENPQLNPYQAGQLNLGQQKVDNSGKMVDIAQQNADTKATMPPKDTVLSLQSKANEGDEKAKAVLDAQDLRKQNLATITGTARGEGFAKGRAEYTLGTYVDSKTNSLVPMTTADVLTANKTAPNRFINAKDVPQYQAKVATEKSFADGPYSLNITALNTAMGHIGTLYDMSHALQTGDYPALNKIGIAWGRQTGNPAPDTFDAAKHAVVGELAKVFKGTSGTEQDAKEISDTINSAQSPEQLKGVLNADIKLLHSRLLALNDTYKRTMGKDYPILNDHSKQVLKQFGYEAEAPSTQSEAGQPSPEDVAAELKRRGAIQ